MKPDKTGMGFDLGELNEASPGELESAAKLKRVVSKRLL